MLAASASVATECGRRDGGTATPFRLACGAQVIHLVDVDDIDLLRDISHFRSYELLAELHELSEKRQGCVLIKTSRAE